MSLVRDAIYILLALLSSPIWMVRLVRTGKIRTDWRQRFGHGPALVRRGINKGTQEPSHNSGQVARTGETPVPPDSGCETVSRFTPRVLVHAVSVGEVNAARWLVHELAQLPERPEIIIATTTDTGFARACELFAVDHHVVRYPFDVSSAVRRFLDRTRPDAAVLMELEVWPNFAAACRRRKIPLMVVNGRLSERSFRRYRLIAPLVRPMFRSLHVAAVQTQEYAERFRALGVRPDRVIVTDTMKWDTAEIADAVNGADELAARMGIDRSRSLIVAGSTAPGEHELLDFAVPRNVQLLCAPRKPEWFDQAEAALSGCVRWSRCTAASTLSNHGATNRFLLDTIGELRRAYALADLVVVGRTFVPLGGSDMIEPVALGKATIVGPHVDHFQFAADALLAGNGLVQVDETDQLATVIGDLLADTERREQLASSGRSVIERHQGATARHVALIRDSLPTVC